MTSPSPRHFLYRMQGAAPALGGDTASWFRFYKWRVEGEVFVPRPRDRHLPASRGDVLWFALDEELVGGVAILHVLVDPLGSGVQELWYVPSEAWIAKETFMLPRDAPALWDEVPVETASLWFRICK